MQAVSEPTADTIRAMTVAAVMAAASVRVFSVQTAAANAWVATVFRVAEQHGVMYLLRRCDVRRWRMMFLLRRSDVFA